MVHISFAKNTAYDSEINLLRLIDSILEEHAKKYNITLLDDAYHIKFDSLIKQISLAHNSKVVVLIDEYDKPILDVIDDLDKARISREILKGLYGSLKDNDQYLKFVFLTGVTKFSKVSLFSGLNNLRDITISHEYADICGYTQTELEKEFSDYLDGVDKEKLKAWYNGYNFSSSELKFDGGLSQKVYNPFDILLFFVNNNEYRNYWFETATPTFLLKLLQQNKYYLPELENYYASEELLSSFDIDKIRFETLLFQSGYLTISEVVSNPISDTINYKLNYPNNEVRSSLTRSLLNYFITEDSLVSNASQSLTDVLVRLDFDELKQVLVSLFAGLPYNWYTNNKIAQYEGFYAMVVYCLFNSLGVTAIPEDKTNKGRIDLTIHLPEYKIIMEFKLTSLGDAKSALQQIKDKNYAQKYLAENKPIYLIGISFNATERNVEDLIWEQYVNI